MKDKTMAPKNIPVLTPAELSDKIFEGKYKHSKDTNRDDMFRRNAKAAAAVRQLEGTAEELEESFFQLMKKELFFPAGRILSNLGTGRQQVTTFNCAIANTIPDSMEGIFDVLKMGALTQKAGAGIGYDFSTIRPKNQLVKGVESKASGPISFMKVFDSACQSIMSAGLRRGANIAILRIDHPDIEEFITAKSSAGVLEMFNLSCGLTDEFLKAVEENKTFDLRFGGEVYSTVKARDLWDKLIKNNYDYAEPGVLFLDTVNRNNSLYYCETISCCNPCGEIVGPPYGVCLLGSMILPSFVNKYKTFDCSRFYSAVRLATHFLDNVIDISKFPIKEQEKEAKNKRRMGLGVTGFADALIKMEIPYNSPEAVRFASEVAKQLANAAYGASSDLAGKFGSFPAYVAEKHKESVPYKTLALEFPDTANNIERKGLRNSHLISIAPTGTISLLASNISSGIEPIFAYDYTRKFRTADGEELFKVYDKVYYEWLQANPDKKRPAYMVSVDDLTPDDHLNVQAAFQKWVCSSISKTINCPADIKYDEFSKIYMKAWKMSLKGATCYHPSGKLKAVLVKDTPEKPVETLPIVSDAVPERPDQLTGVTYKLKDGQGVSYYITINDLVEGSQTRPFEIFCSSKNLAAAATLATMTRLLSTIFRREKDISFIVNELSQISDPSGGYWSNGVFYCSLQAHIAACIDAHVQALSKKGVFKGKHVKDKTVTPESEKKGKVTDPCPLCGKQLIRKENCLACSECTWSRCQ